MTSQWTSKYAIMRDLSLAQGCDIPADLDDPLGVDEKPPLLLYKEETEEEYFEHCSGDDTYIQPDISLIQHMLEMVRATDISSDCDDGPDKVFEITKSPKALTENIPQKQTNENVQKPIPVKKQKRKRENVAVNSILEAIASDVPIANMEQPKHEPLKLLKPTDFISTEKELDITEKEIDLNEKEVLDSVKKVNGWLDAQDKEAHQILAWHPSSMFKRKGSSMNKITESDHANSPQVQKSVSTGTASYRPSNLADEYYQKFVERSKLKDLVKEDVWTRAEKIMKEIDLKKKQEMEEEELCQEADIVDGVANTPEPSDDADIVQGILEVQLPQHRHLLTGECVVCEVVESRGYDVPNEETS